MNDHSNKPFFRNSLLAAVALLTIAALLSAGKWVYNDLHSTTLNVEAYHSFTREGSKYVFTSADSSSYPVTVESTLNFTISNVGRHRTDITTIEWYETAPSLTGLKKKRVEDIVKLDISTSSMSVPALGSDGTVSNPKLYNSRGEEVFLPLALEPQGQLKLWSRTKVKIPETAWNDIKDKIELGKSYDESALRLANRNTSISSFGYLDENGDVNAHYYYFNVRIVKTDGGSATVHVDMLGKKADGTIE